jgi:2-C-methyl-D-erythritol 2,4-cyclodiphosphate synthase
VSDIRVGLGFDVHPIDVSRELWLGGVPFEGEPGLAGHSDGDAVCHAIADALLGAAALGDIGQHFPDTDPAVEGITGVRLVRAVLALLRDDTGLAPIACDVTVLCDRPAIEPRREEMRATLADVLEIPVDRMSVKATRPEGLGLSGDGVGCFALATLR